VIVEVNGRPVHASDDFRREIQEGRDGGVNVKWIRKGDRQQGLLTIR
jgi:S1-C subfamily serine protease